MYVVITYDVNTETADGRSRLRNIAKTCMKYGQRVQNSVFECLIEPSDYLVLLNRLLEIMDMKLDSLRIYRLGKTYSGKIESYGKERHVPIDDVMIL